MTNGDRVEVADEGTLVQGVHLGAADIDMIVGKDGPKTDLVQVARASLAGFEAGAIEMLVDDPTRFVKAALSGDHAQLYGWHPLEAHCGAVRGPDRSGGDAISRRRPPPPVASATALVRLVPLLVVSNGVEESSGSAPEPASGEWENDSPTKNQEGSGNTSRPVTRG